jgi:hypothetical protein
MIRRDDFCGEHPEALKERQERMGPSLDPAAMLSVAAGQFMGNYFSQKFKEGQSIPAMDEEKAKEVAKGITEFFISDFSYDEKMLKAWVSLGEERREELRSRWSSAIVSYL